MTTESVRAFQTGSGHLTCYHQQDMEIGKPAGFASADRRRSPRIAGSDSWTMSFEGQVAPLAVLDVSAGGFAIASREVLRVGEIRQVEFRLGSAERAVRLRAKCVYCDRMTGASAGRYRAGFSFVTWSDAESRALAQLIDDVTGVLSFD